MASHKNVNSIPTPNNDESFSKPALSSRPQAPAQTAPPGHASPRSFAARATTAGAGATGTPSSSSAKLMTLFSKVAEKNSQMKSGWTPIRTTNSNSTSAASSTTTTPRSAKRTNNLSLATVVANTTSRSDEMRRGNTHTLLINVSEHQKRIKSAIGSTFNTALKPPEKSPEQTASHKGYCRERIMHSSRGYRVPKDQMHDTMFPLPRDAKDRPVTSSCVKHDIYLTFHQMEGRTEEERKLCKNYFSIGPGQYDNVDPEIAQRRPHTTSGAVVKFSPSDRFPNRYIPDTPGPWSYMPTPESLLPRPFSATLSQTSREALNEPATMNVMSSYYYEPPSSFDPLASNTTASTWGYSPRFKGRGLYSKAEIRKLIEERKAAVATGAIGDQQDQQQQDEEGDKVDELGNPASTTMATATGATTSSSKTKNYMEKNMERIRLLEAKKKQQQAAAQREYERKLCLEYGPAKAASILAAGSSTTNNASNSSPHRSLGIQKFSKKFLLSEKCQQLIHSWSIHTMTFAFSSRLVRHLQLVALCRQVYQFKMEIFQKKIFDQWKRLDATVIREYSANQIQKNFFRCRISCRIMRKRQHAHILRLFLIGMSFEVRFAIGARKIKRKVLLIQRWWRHVRLMVRSREEALVLKWNLVENRLRRELLTQIPFYHRAFVQNAANDSQWNKTLGLLEPKKWFLARFVLYGDGTLRAFEVLPEEMPTAMTTMTPRVSSSTSSRTTRNPSASEVVTQKVSISCPSCKPSHQRTGGRRRLSFVGGGRPSIGFNSINEPNSKAPVNHKLSLPRVSTVANTVGAGVYTEKANAEEEEEEGKEEKEQDDEEDDEEEDDDKEEQEERGVLLIELKHFVMNYHEMDPSFGGETIWHPYLSLFKNNGSKLLCLTSFHIEELKSWKEKLEKWMNRHHHHPHHHGLFVSTRSMDLPLTSEDHQYQSSKQMLRQAKKKKHTVLCETYLSYFVIDLLRDAPKCPSNVLIEKIRERTRVKRKLFRSEIHRFRLEMYHFHLHEQNSQQNFKKVTTKFQDFFHLKKPERPHFKSLLSTKKIEKIIQQTVEQVKVLCPSNPQIFLDK